MKDALDIDETNNANVSLHQIELLLSSAVGKPAGVVQQSMTKGH